MDELYQKLAGVKSFDQWGATYSDDTSFKVTEGWLNHATGKVRHRLRTVEKDGMASWLAERSIVETKNGTQCRQSLVLRLVWVNADVPNRKVMLAEDVQQALLQAFGLELAHGYSRSCITDVSAIPPADEQSDHKTYSFCFLPKLVCVWSHSRVPSDAPSDEPGQYVTQGLMFVPERDAERDILNQLLDTPWNKHLYSTAMLPPLLFSMLLLAQMYTTESETKDSVQETERFTGHHDFKTLSKGHEAAEKDTAEFAARYARISGHASRLSSTERKAKMVEALLEFIQRSLYGPAQDASTRKGGRYLGSHVLALQNRLAMLRVDTEFTLKRVQVQTNALAGLISQSDSLANIRLAKSQNELAKSQTELAFHSYRDSSSMKTLAIVTMFFLPGSFISALFSTNLFDWDAVEPGSGSLGVRTTPQFKLYWIISILLTLATFVLYYLWLWLEKRRKKKRHAEFGQAKDDEEALSEKGKF